MIMTRREEVIREEHKNRRAARDHVRFEMKSASSGSATGTEGRRQASEGLHGRDISRTSLRVRVPHAHASSPERPVATPGDGKAVAAVVDAPSRSYNQFFKIDAGLVRVWAAILQRVPDAYLVTQRRPTRAPAPLPHTLPHARRADTARCESRRVPVCGCVCVCVRAWLCLCVR